MSLPLRRSEEYPLLNPDGGGDKPLNQSATDPVEWNVTCAPKRSWISRWPQFLSACWMSVVLLTILFVIFYAFGSIYRLQSMVMLKHESKPANEVYYHYIIPRDNSVPFKSFANYLSYMATRYPLLNFNVYLLIDDTPQSSVYTFPSKSLRFKRFIPKYFGPISYVTIQNNDRDIEDIQRKYPNVNVSVLSLSKYTAKTSLQNTWRSIPVTYLPFYLRANEIWKNGGIGLNLLTQNYRFNVLKRIDLNLDALLKRHSKMADLTTYIQAIDNIDSPDEREFFAVVFDAFNEIPRMMYQTFYNFGVVSHNEDMRPPTPSLKVKRSISITGFENVSPNKTKTNVTIVKTHQDNETNGNDSKAFNATPFNDITKINNITVNKQNNSGIVKEHDNLNSAPHFYHVHDISRLMDNIAAFHEIVDMKNAPDYHNTNHKNYLTLNADGNIVAAYTRNHPLLMKLLYSPKIFKCNPRYVISDTVRENCFESMHRVDYCDSFQILNNF